MKILGIDQGNFNLKTSEFYKCESKLKRDLDVQDKQSNNLVVFNGQEYLIGEGIFDTETVKIDKETYKINMLTAIARSCPEDDEFYIVTGLPSFQNTEKNIKKLQEEIFRDKGYRIKVDGEDRNIIIKNIAVCSENTAPYFALTDEEKSSIGNNELIIINFGGSNTNISHYKILEGKRKLAKQQTVPVGIFDAYRDYVEYINSELGLSKSIEDAENIIKDGISKFGKKQDLSFADKAFSSTFDIIMKDINRLPFKDSYIILTGGGVSDFKKYALEKLPHAVVQKDNLFATAIGLKKVGEKLWVNKK